ncbi:uncharacterized protein [Nicotiana sylvestris]|uniref:uncharacterized protein n=1 Tax=Nicotiana sylvestris TaxID=4096 RepID=UPI00388CE3E1
MAKTSKIVPQKEKASSSWPAGDKIPCLREEEEEDEDADFELVARTKRSINAPKVAEPVMVEEVQPRTEEILEGGPSKVPESLEAEDASRRDEQSADRGKFRKPNPRCGNGPRRGRPFHGCFTGVEDASDLGDASSIFDEAHRLPSQALTLHREAFSKSRSELSWYEADLKRLTEERDALRLLSGQKEEQIKVLRAELAITHKEHTDLIDQVQKKAEMIEQLRKVANMMRAETLGWKQNMDRLASEKETARTQLSSAECQLQSMKEESSGQAKKMEELEARLVTELDKAKSKVETAKVNAEAIAGIYRSDAEASQARAKEIFDAAQARAFCIAEHAKCQSRRETLEEIHAKSLLSSDDDDSGSMSGSEGSEDEDEAPGED